jgi:transcriptional regulator with XRE-family HTH domain
MNLFAKNLKALRSQKGLKQEEIKDYLGYPRTTWSSYEQGNSQPSIDEILRIAKFFDVGVTELLSADLSDASLLQKKGGTKKRQNASLNASPNASLIAADQALYNRVPHVITVDKQGHENIAYVPVRAKAGYLTGYADPGFVSTLPTYSLPGLQNATFRMFEIEGHSMIPTFDDSDIIITRFVENLSQVRNDRVHVIVTKNDGLLVKRVLNRAITDGKLILNSDNQKDPRDYPPIIIGIDEVLEVWYGIAKFTRQMRAPGEMYNKLIDVEARLTLLEDSHRKLLK